MIKREVILGSVTSMILLLNACGGGSSDISSEIENGTPSISGILTDSPVEGATYVCGEVKQITDREGAFFCDVTPVAFYVGDVKLGSIVQLPDDGYVTPQDLSGVSRESYDENVIKIAVFLQSLDNDGDIESGISLNEKQISALKERKIELQSMTYTSMVELLDQIGVLNIVSKADALDHLQRHTAQLDISDKKRTNEIIQEDNVTSEPEAKHEEVVPSLDNALKQSYLDLINEARAEGRECGDYGYFEAADPLVWNDNLYGASYEHSKDMAISNTFSHTGSGMKSDITAEALHPGSGSSVSERIEYNGYINWRRYGENIAAGTSMDEAVLAMEGWLASPGHCKNIMNADFKEVGMAFHYKEGSHYTYYWTQDFATKK